MGFQVGAGIFLSKRDKGTEESSLQKRLYVKDREQKSPSESKQRIHQSLFLQVLHGPFFLLVCTILPEL